MSRKCLFARTGVVFALVTLALIGIGHAEAATTVIRFETALGSFDVELYEDAAPITVENFLTYAADGAYADTFFHRLMNGFVLQGGGFAYDPTAGTVLPDHFLDIPTNDPIVNEFGISNTRGTIAMAKRDGDPDSATNEFFFNLGDNSANLDNQNGGFTVFGAVIGDGMDVVDALASQEVWDAAGTPQYPRINSAFGDLPLIGYQADEALGSEHLEMIQSLRLLGDVDGDFSVGQVDLDLIIENWGLDVQDSTLLNGEGIVDIVELNELLIHWQSGLMPVEAPVTVPIPEPVTLVLLATACPLLMRRRLRRR